MITPQGHIFEREVVLEYLLTKKKQIAKETKRWEKQCEQEKEDEKKVNPCFSLFIFVFGVVLLLVLTF